MNLDQVVYTPLRQLSFRGKYRLSRLIIPTTGNRKARIFGSLMELDLSDYIQRSMYAGLYEVEDVAWFRSVLRPGMVFVDVGANVGYYTALAAYLVGARGKVIACEPDPHAFGKLQRFVHSNGLSQVHCHNVALSDQPHKLSLFVPPKSYGNHNPSTARYCDGMTEQMVSATTLDQCFSDLGLTSVELLKIDVEGHELKVLQGAQQSIRERRIKRILCEFNEKMLAHNGVSSHELRECLLRLGYRDLSGSFKISPFAENRRFVVSGL